MARVITPGFARPPIRASRAPAGKAAVEAGKEAEKASEAKEKEKEKASEAKVEKEKAAAARDCMNSI